MILRRMLASRFSLRGTTCWPTTLARTYSPPAHSSSLVHHPCVLLGRHTVHRLPREPVQHAKAGHSSHPMHTAVLEVDVDSQPAAQHSLGMLDEYQKPAAVASSRVVRVVAGPSSGKTRLLVARAVYLINSGLKPDNMMIITFTRRAANELQERLGPLLPPAAQKRMAVGTFHNMCSKLVRKHVGRLQCGLTPSFVICDKEDQQAHIKHVFSKLADPAYAGMSGLDNTTFTVDQFASHMHSLRNSVPTTCDLSDDEISLAWGMPNKKVAAKLTRVFRLYQESLVSCNAVDFDDLLHYAVHLLQQYPEVRSKWQAQYRHILVDEFQDTNIRQYEFLKLVTGQDNNLFVVGDVNQCIYEWRGAHPSIMEKILQQHYPDLSSMNLRKNYRSGEGIIRAGEAVVLKNQAPPMVPVRDHKSIVQHHTFPDSAAEAKWIAGKIKQFMAGGLKGSDIAVLYSKSALKSKVVPELVKQGSKHQVVGEKGLLERKEVKDVVAYLTWTLNPQDFLSLNRLVSTPPRGIGPAAIKLLEQASAAAGTTSWAHLITSELTYAWLSRDEVQQVLVQLKEWQSLSFEQRLAQEGSAEQVLQQVAPDLRMAGARSLVKGLQKKAAEGVDDLRALLVLMRSVSQYASIEDAVGVLMWLGGYTKQLKKDKENEAKRKHRPGPPDEQQIFEHIDLLLAAIRRVDNAVASLRADPQTDQQVSDAGLQAVVASLLSDPDMALPESWEGVDEPGPAHPLQALSACLEYLSMEYGETEGMDEDKAREGAVLLSTLHKSKGTEYKVVFIIGWEEGNLPWGDAYTDIERQRLAYVGITRAMDKLYLTTSMTRRQHWEDSQKPPLDPSEFLRWIHKKAGHHVDFKDHAPNYGASHTARRQPDVSKLRRYRP